MKKKTYSVPRSLDNNSKEEQEVEQIAIPDKFLKHLNATGLLGNLSQQYELNQQNLGKLISKQTEEWNNHQINNQQKLRKELQKDSDIGDTMRKKMAELQKSLGASSEISKLSEKFQKKYDISSQLLKQADEFQRKFGVGNQLLKQSEDLQKKYGIGSQLLKQAEDLQKKYGIGSQLLKQSEDLQKKYGIGSQLLKQSEDLQKKYGIGSQLLKQSEDLQKKYGIGSQLLKQSEDLQKKYGIGSQLLKQSEDLQKKYGIGSQLLKQSMDLQRKYGIGSQLLKQAEEFQRKLGIGRTLQKEFDLMHNLAGINSIQSMLQDLQNHSLTRSKKDILNTFDNTFLHFAEENLPSVSEAIETGLASVAKAYTDGVAQSTNQTNVQSGQATSTDINYSPATNAPRSLIDLLQGLPPSIQALILFLLYQVLIGAVADYGKGKVLVEINKAESYIVSLFESKPVTKSNIVKHNKNIAWDSLNQFRVITGENVRLRTKPSLNSDIIETIGKNTIVAILEKKERQWLYVQVQSGDELVTGWITRTYTKPLKG